VLAVFGEYLDTKDDTPRPGCKYALETAGQVIEQFGAAADEWLEHVFQLSEYVKLSAEEVSVSARVAIHYGEVTFDYIGGKGDVAFVALGREVSLVRQLALVEDDKPIILSRSAEIWSQDVLHDLPGDPVGQVRRGRLVDFPGHPEERYAIYAVRPANIDLLSR
jgi:class 3 adenylate cyclase